MAFELEWRQAAGAPGRWRQFATADDLKSFVADGAAAPLNGELRVRSSNTDVTFDVVTTAAAIARWSPPAPPAPLVAARWTVEDAADAGRARHVQRLRACLGSARNDGLLEPAQVEALVSIFDEAVAGEGPAGRHTEALAGRPDDISQAGSASTR